jgi:hypothetical protein
VTLWSSGDDADDTFRDILLQPIIFNKFLGIDFLEVANFETSISEQLSG